MTEQQERVEINWVQVSASALAAVSSAVLLSTVGVAGTIIGAAIGSVFATAGSAIYSHYLRISRERVARAQAAALERVSRARSHASGAWADSRTSGSRTRVIEAQRATEELGEAERELDDTEVAGRAPWREVLAGLPWKRIALVAAGVFLVAMVVIVSFELIAGRSVSSYTGGSSSHARTSIPGLGGSAKPASSTPTQGPSSSGTSTPTSEPTTTAPTTGSTPGTTSSTPPAQAPSDTAPAPSAPAPTPSVAPTPSPVQTPVG